MVREIPATNIGLLLSIVALSFVLSTVSPYFFQWDNGLNIGRAAAYGGIAAAVTTLALIGGAIDLSIGAVMALVSVVAARALTAGVPVSVVILICLAVGVACGALNGGLVTFVGINALVVTIGTQFVIRGIAWLLSRAQGAELLITDKDFLYAGQEMFLGLPVSIWLLFLSLAAVWWVLNRTVFGRHCQAIGGNPVSARLVGIPLARRRMQLYILSGLGSACAGIVMASYSGAGIAYAATGIELTVIGAVVLGGTHLLGGRGSVFGTFLGITLLGVIQNGIILLGLDTAWQMICSGTALLAAVVIDEVRAKLRAR